MEGGHYTSVCKNGSSWYEYDDEVVKEISQGAVKVCRNEFFSFCFDRQSFFMFGFFRPEQRTSYFTHLRRNSQESYKQKTIFNNCKQKSGCDIIFYVLCVYTNVIFIIVYEFY